MTAPLGSSREAELRAEVVRLCVAVTAENLDTIARVMTRAVEARQHFATGQTCFCTACITQRDSKEAR